ncbi:hypothetical protein B0A48_03044 [Cryoendolithus antarcticus]|uniref:Uncharacterized protein n=1 Tax=Cryoendolithus antarcticus TaxID=1507870 RepID=A0A1V8TMF4_9PEZI|nr:hypothetical protein B0A48_03044 [Cryoendolithus antarcticus]
MTNTSQPFVHCLQHTGTEVHPNLDLDLDTAACVDWIVIHPFDFDQARITGVNKECYLTCKAMGQKCGLYTTHKEILNYKCVGVATQCGLGGFGNVICDGSAVSNATETS